MFESAEQEWIFFEGYIVVDMFKKSGCSQERSLEQDFLSTLEPETSIVSNGCFKGMMNQIFTWGNGCFTISIHFKTGSLGVPGPDSTGSSAGIFCDAIFIDFFWECDFFFPSTLSRKIMEVENNPLKGKEINSFWIDPFSTSMVAGGRV